MKRTLARSRRHLKDTPFKRRLRRIGYLSFLLGILVVIYIGQWVVRNAADLYPVRAAGGDIPEVTLVDKIIVPDSSSEDAKSRWAAFVIAAHKVAPMYNYPVEVVLAQGALESAHGTSKFSIDRNNFLGIGAYDSDPNSAFHYENPEQCVIEYMRLIKRNFPEAWSHRDNKEVLLKALKVNSAGKMYATDPEYVSKVMSMKEWN